MSEAPTPPGGSGPGRGTMRDVRTGAEFRSYARNRLIESRLTPNSISMTGLVLNVPAAVLIVDGDFVIGGLVCS